MLKAEITPYILNFAFTAHTSRETFTQKPTFFIDIFEEENPTVKGRGEIAFFPSLQPSFPSMKVFLDDLNEIVDNIDYYAKNPSSLPRNSAIRFGVEMALDDLKLGGRGYYQPQDVLSNLQSGIKINGLVWMNDIETMLGQIDSKIRDGFHCIKLKIGAIDFSQELKMLRHIRQSFKSTDLEIRVDANGAWTADEVMNKLDCLSHFEISSIEQPIPRDQEFMAELCKKSPIPVALDEDMIERWWNMEQSKTWLNNISPAYIVLKPSLIGGFKRTKEWIEVAKDLGIGWWITSALESNLGLSAIAQFLGNYPENLNMAHGLGTGQIYTNNVDSRVKLNGERLHIVESSLV